MPDRVRQRLLYSVASQGASSLGNLAVTLIAARNFNQTDFGAFATAYVVFLLVVGAVRSLIGESVLVSRIKTGDRQSASQIYGAAIVITLFVVATVATVAPLFADPLTVSLVCLAAVLPAMTLHDVGRQIAFSLGDASGALIADLTWLISQTVLLGLAILSSLLYPWSLVVIWGLGAVPSALLLMARFGWPRPSLRWLHEHWTLCWRYFTEWSVTIGGAYGAILGLGLIVGVDAVGSVRAAQTLFGPLNTLFAGVVTVLVPVGVVRSTERLLRMSGQASVAFAAAAAALTALLATVPDSVGVELFGATWSSASSIVLPVGSAAIAGGVLAGALVGLRSLRAAHTTLRVRLVTAPLITAAPIALAFPFGTNGFVWATALGATVAAALWWFALRSNLAGPWPRPERH